MMGRGAALRTITAFSREVLSCGSWDLIHRASSTGSWSSKPSERSEEQGIELASSWLAIWVVVLCRYKGAKGPKYVICAAAASIYIQNQSHSIKLKYLSIAHNRQIKISPTIRVAPSRNLVLSSCHRLSSPPSPRSIR